MRPFSFRAAPGPFARRGALALVAFFVLALGMSARAQSQEPKPKITPSAATAVATITPAATPTGQTGVHGNAYISPTFGFTLAWDPKVWAVKDERLLQGYDGLELGTDRSNLFVEGISDYAGDPAACLADARQQISGRSGISAISDFQGPGRPIQDTDGAKSLLVGYVAKLPDGSSASIVEFVQCRTLVPGQAVLELTWQTSDADYAQQLPLVAALLKTLHVPGAAATPVAATPEGSPAATPLALPGATPVGL
ncbi:MAG TPA: hypothetical protein VFQ80_13290 [Thermomicrobiales bacterium]|nr:hypothetical protein [Thermomicrobiales bacterium]